MLRGCCVGHCAHSVTGCCSQGAGQVSLSSVGGVRGSLHVKTRFRGSEGILHHSIVSSIVKSCRKCSCIAALNRRCQSRFQKSRFQLGDLLLCCFLLPRCPTAPKLSLSSSVGAMSAATSGDASDGAHVGSGTTPGSSTSRVSPTAPLVCKFCQSLSTDADPLAKPGPQQGTIRWRRPRGRECNICPYFIARDYASTSCAALEEQLAASPEARKQFLAGRQAYIAERQAAPRGRAHRQGSSKMPAAISAFSQEKLTYKKHLGFLWPIKLYTQVHKRRPPSRDIVTHTVSGRPVRGILLDGTHGCPPGVVEIFTESSTGVDKTAELAAADAEDESGAEAADAAWAAGQRRNRIDVVATGQPSFF